MGWLSDRTVSRWGRRIPYVVGGAPLAAIFTVLLFTTPGDGSTAKTAIYLFFTLELASLFGAVVSGRYEALQPEMAPTSEERVSIQGKGASRDERERRLPRAPFRASCSSPWDSSCCRV